MKMLLVGAKLHGGGGPAVKRRGRRRGGLGGESRGGRKGRRGDNEVEEMVRWGWSDIYTDRLEETVDQIGGLPAIVSSDSTVWMWRFVSEAQRPEMTGLHDRRLALWSRVKLR